MAKTMAEECPHLRDSLVAEPLGAEAGLGTHLLDPPRPSLPQWKVTMGFLSNPYDLISKARAECGDLFLLTLPGLGRVAFLCQAGLLHEVYRKPESQVVAGEIRGRILAELTGHNTSTCLDGPEFRDRRRVAAPYLNGKKVEQHLPYIVELTEQLVASLEVGKEHELQHHFDWLTRRAISRILFGARNPERAEELTGLVSLYLQAFEWRSVQAPFLRKRLGPWSPWSRFLKRREDLYRALEVDVRRLAEADESTEDDLLSALVRARLYDDPEQAVDAVVQELIGLVVGGAETTSKGLSWVLRGLLSEPSALAMLQRELDEVLGDRPMAGDDLKQLPYLAAVVQEGLRHQSIGPFAGPRLAKEDIEIGGFRIPAGTVLVQALHEVGRGPLFPDPETFDPGHFFGCPVKQRDWFPFGGGTRKCTGMGLALVELAAVIGTLVQRADLQAGSGSTNPVQSGIAHRPRNNMRVRYLGRRSERAGP